MCADSHTWLSPWATVKANSTKHTVGSSSSAVTVTSSLTGLLREDARTRDEFLSLVRS